MITQKLLELELEFELEKKKLAENLNQAKENIQVFSEILDYQWR